MAHQTENRKLAAELNLCVANFYHKHHKLDNALASKRPGTDIWTLKEILGHLIDSASNNHQRFIRLQIVDQLIFPDYGKDNLKWVQFGHYNDMDFADVILTWKQYNLLIAKIIEKVDVSRLSNYWKTDGKEIKLSELMEDYVAHLKGHLASFENTLRQLQI